MSATAAACAVNPPPQADSVLRVFRDCVGDVVWRRALPRYMTGWARPFHATLQSDLNITLRFSNGGGPVAIVIPAADVLPILLGTNAVARAMISVHLKKLEAPPRQFGQFQIRPNLPSVGEVLKVVSVAISHRNGYLWGRQVPKYMSGWGAASWLRLRSDLALEIQYGSTSAAPVFFCRQSRRVERPRAV